MKIAVIREEECVGCAKCLDPCPVDAIIGAPQFLHSVLTHECIGCGLCVDPCPMDCIEMLPQNTNVLEKTKVQNTVNERERERERENESENELEHEYKNEKIAKAKQRFIAKKTRKIKEAYPQLPNANEQQLNDIKEKIRGEISAAVERVKQKKLQKIDTNVVDIKND